jgi:hypothetical protein
MKCKKSAWKKCYGDQVRCHEGAPTSAHASGDQIRQERKHSSINGQSRPSYDDRVTEDSEKQCEEVIGARSTEVEEITVHDLALEYSLCPLEGDSFIGRKGVPAEQKQIGCR